jgi:hypothetical protein
MFEKANSYYTQGGIMMLRLFVSFFSLSVLLFSGCATFTPPKENPVRYDNIPLSRILGGRFGSVFSMTPERRTVIVIPNKGTSKFRICAEPPSDVAENLASTIRFLAEAQVKKPETLAGVSAEFYREFASSPMRLFYRSQGIQLFRDGMYNLCQAYMNDVITKEQYMEKYTELLDTAKELIEGEMPSLEARKINEAVERAMAAENAAKAASNNAKISKDAAEKALEDVKKIRSEIK